MALSKTKHHALSESQEAISGATVVLDAGTGGTLVVPGGDMLLVADFVRSGPDLLLAGPVTPGQYAQAGTQEVLAAIGTVETADGAVTATRIDGTQVTLTVDSPVFQGDVLETSGRAAVGIVFNDDSRVSLGADARMVLDELIYDPDTSAGLMALSVLQGATALRAAAGPTFSTTLPWLMVVLSRPT